MRTLIWRGQKNDILAKRAEADEIKFDYGEKLTNLNSTPEDLFNDF